MGSINMGFFREIYWQVTLEFGGEGIVELGHRGGGFFGAWE